MDRNVFLTLTVRNVPMSLSARRAWIEIRAELLRMCHRVDVALRKESVDRNFVHSLNLPSSPSRSPQGERG